MLLRIAFATLLLVLALSAEDSAWPRKKCRALILEGGGDHGAYEAGAMWGFVETMDANEVAWDYIDGISAGGINAAYAFTSEKGTEKIMVEDLIALWRSFSRKDVYTTWKGGILYSVIAEPSIFNNEPLRKFLKKQLEGRKIQRPFGIGTFNFNTGDYVVFDETTVT